MRRLYDKVLYAVSSSAVKRLFNIIDLFTVPCLNMVDDDLRGKCSPDAPVGIGLGYGFFNA